MEIRKKCAVCGTIFCYTQEDINENITNAALSTLSALGSLASAFGGGTIFHTGLNSRNAQYYGDKHVDYSKCPKCGSHSLIDITFAGPENKNGNAENTNIQNVKHIEINTNASAEMLLKRAAMFLEDGEWETADAYANAALDIEPENAAGYVVKLMSELKVHELFALAECEKPFDENKNYLKSLRFGDDNTKKFLEECTLKIKEKNENLRLEKEYQKAASKMGGAKTEEEFLAAADSFKKIESYKDAKALLDDCLKKAEEARKDNIYSNACRFMNEENSSSCQKALSEFESIPGWKDVDLKVKECREKVEKLLKKEERERIAKEKTEKKKKKIGLVLAAAVALLLIGVFVFNMLIIPNKNYDKAVKLVEEGNYIDGYEMMMELKGHKDSKKIADSIYLEYKKACFGQTPVGSFVTLGTYEQDNVSETKDEEIEWLILKKKDDKVLVISRYGLDCVKYNNERDFVTWEKSSIRKWMNKDFLNAAFTADEQSIILKDKVSASKNPDYDTDPGKSTKDKVFLLSIDEAEKYLRNDEITCPATAYAQANGSYNPDDCVWWLRTPGKHPKYAAYVAQYGTIEEDGYYVDYIDLTVRPAMWIDIK